MQVIERFTWVDAILKQYAKTIGDDLVPYRNHIYRMINFVNALAALNAQKLNEEALHKVEVAAAFHDIGIWTQKTVDYIGPSVSEAFSWMQTNSKGQEFLAVSQEISDMIEWHHKISAIQGNASPLPELFRQGDLVDFSLGLVRHGLPRDHIRKVKSTFPNAGFHKMLMRLSLKRLLSHPLDPAPMMRR